MESRRCNVHQKCCPTWSKMYAKNVYVCLLFLRRRWWPGDGRFVLANLLATWIVQFVDISICVKKQMWRIKRKDIEDQHLRKCAFISNYTKSYRPLKISFEIAARSFYFRPTQNAQHIYRCANTIDCENSGFSAGKWLPWSLYEGEAKKNGFHLIRHVLVNLVRIEANDTNKLTNTATHIFDYINTMRLSGWTCKLIHIS